VDLLAKYHRLLQLVTDSARHFFGDEWQFYADRSYFRRHIGVAKKVPWHIDADGAAIGRQQCINVWLPLDPVGRDLPSLDVVPHSHATMRSIPMLTGEHRYREDAFVARIGSAYTPVLNPGDALVFDQFTLHRTQCVGTPETIRTACEFRFERD
jgi:ectoine hydroxylase-related dioxygenase (phytanoyl-CoA dioxygenase family)